MLGPSRRHLPLIREALALRRWALDAAHRRVRGASGAGRTAGRVVALPGRAERCAAPLLERRARTRTSGRDGAPGGCPAGDAARARRPARAARAGLAGGRARLAGARAQGRGSRGRGTDPGPRGRGPAGGAGQRPRSGRVPSASAAARRCRAPCRARGWSTTTRWAAIGSPGACSSSCTPPFPMRNWTRACSPGVFRSPVTGRSAEWPPRTRRGTCSSTQRFSIRSGVGACGTSSCWRGRSAQLSPEERAVLRSRAGAHPVAAVAGALEMAEPLAAAEVPPQRFLDDRGARLPSACRGGASPPADQAPRAGRGL
jgi:hypothetical protein